MATLSFAVPQSVIMTNPKTTSNAAETPNIHNNPKVPPKQRLKRKILDAVPPVVPPKVPNRNGVVTVLNIPKFSMSIPSFRVSRRPKVSKLDLATLRRKARRQRKMGKSRERNCTNNGASVLSSGLKDLSYSSSSSDSEDETSSRVDLWIKSGPPLKPELSTTKLNFMGLFELTTHVGKNNLEIQKMERKRHYYTPLRIEVDLDHSKLYPLDLPVPFGSPTILNHDCDFKVKSNFFHLLGLGWVPQSVRKEMEKTWQKILNDRLRRRCESSLTKYYIQSLPTEKLSAIQDRASVIKKESSVHTDNPVKREYTDKAFNCTKQDSALGAAKDDDLFKIPLVHQFGHLRPKTEVKCEIDSDTSDEGSLQLFENKWPGLPEVMTMYHQYNKERSLEIDQLRERKRLTKDLISKQQHEVRLLEQRQKEVLKKQHDKELEAKVLRLTIEKLTNIVNAIR